MDSSSTHPADSRVHIYANVEFRYETPKTEGTTRTSKIAREILPKKAKKAKFSRFRWLANLHQGMETRKTAKNKERHAVYQCYRTSLKSNQSEGLNWENAIVRDLTEINPPTTLQAERAGAIVKEAKQLAKQMEKIERLLEEKDPKNPGKVNKQVLKEIRTTLKTDAYQELKKNEHSPAVRVLHDLCVATMLKTEVMDIYEELAHDMDPHEVASGVDHKAIPEQLEQFRSHIHQGGMHKADMKNPFYLFQHPASARGALASQKSSGEAYDPRGKLENHAGLAFKHTLGFKGQEVRMHHFFTPSWRLGVTVPPEVHAVLQSLENRIDWKEDHHPVKQICYNNAQDLRKGPEGVSSAAIMRLQKLYPRAFRPITLPCDTPFAKRKLGHAPNLWKKVKKRRDFINMDLFADKFRNQLLEDENFDIEKNQSNGNGYAFPKGERKQWGRFINVMCDNLGNKYQSIVEKKGLDPNQKLTSEQKVEMWKLEAAMIEEGHLMLGWYNQLVGLDFLEKLDVPLTQGVTDVCKELADRGKMRTVIQLYANKGAATMPQEVMREMRAMSEGRPLMARYRMGLAHRNQGGYALMQHRSPEQLRQMYVEIEREITKGENHA